PPDHTDADEHEKGDPPHERAHQPCDDRRRNSTAQTRAHEHHAVSGSALTFGKPLRKASRDIGKRPGLAHTKQKARCNQRSEIPGQACRRCEDGPPQHDPSEDLSWSDDVAQPPARNLKRGICKCECAEYPADLNGGQVELTS